MPDANTLTQLRQQVHQIEGSRRITRMKCVSSGCAELDHCLPAGGFCGGTLVEWLVGGRGNGAGTLALLAAREAMAKDGGALVVLDRSTRFYPPAAAAWGIDLDRTVIIRAGTVQDEIWAAEQALRCTSISALWAPFAELDWKAFRRLQLAAEQGGGVGFLLRPIKVRGEPSWADTQLLVEAVGNGNRQQSSRRFRLQLTRCRGGQEGQVMHLELDEENQVVSKGKALPLRHEANAKHLAAQLAHPKAPRRSARA